MGPLEVEAIRIPVQAKDEQRIGPVEAFLVVRTIASDPEYWFYLSNADASVALTELLRVAKARHLVEECLQRAKGEAGLAQYEVRSWVGWHHHMTLSLLATWFLTLEQRRVGKKNTGSDRATDGVGVSHAVA
jgi:SRSO17 transposase